jgi:hypothetical protein
VDVDARLWMARGPLADARLRADTRGRDGDIREKLAAAPRLAERPFPATGFVQKMMGYSKSNL